MFGPHLEPEAVLGRQQVQPRLEVREAHDGSRGVSLDVRTDPRQQPLQHLVVLTRKQTSSSDQAATKEIQIDETRTNR